MRSIDVTTLPISLLVLQEQLPPYRIPIFERLAARPEIDLTVATSSDRPIISVPTFSTQMYSVRSGHRFVRAKIGPLIASGRYDVVVTMFNMRWIDFMVLALRRHEFGLVYWGIGLSSAQGFRKRLVRDWLRRCFATRADALILYSREAQSVYAGNAKLRDRTFIAHNTVDVPDSRPLGAEGNQRSFLFIGTLRHDKGIDELLDAYAIARPQFRRQVTLTIIGDGPARDEVCARINEMGLANYVLLAGAIHELADQEKHFSDAIACISPWQAGLSVLSSMAYGVPFVTRADSITGGERFNITSGENGVLYQGGVSQLAAEMVTLVEDTEHTRRMGRAAYHHYQANRTADQMIESYVQAVQLAARSARTKKRQRPRTDI